MGGYESISENLPEDGDEEETSPRPPHTWKTRKKTPVEKLHYWASLITASTIIFTALSYGFHKLPFAMADEFSALKDHVSQIDRSLSSLQVNQLQSLQLQLMDRRDKLDEQISKASPQFIFDLRAARNETQQRLDEITSEINTSRVGH